MSEYPFSTIDNRNFVSLPRREGVAVDSTANTSNAVDEQNFITEGGATLADFVVAIAHQAMPAFTRAPRNQTQGCRFQLERRAFGHRQ